MHVFTIAFEYCRHDSSEEKDGNTLAETYRTKFHNALAKPLNLLLFIYTNKNYRSYHDMKK